MTFRSKLIKRMVIKMKKTVSLLLAVIFAAIAICTFAVSAFAEPTDAPAGPNVGDWTDPTDPPSTAAPSTEASSTAAPSTEAASTEAASTEAPSTAATTAGTTLADDTPVDGGSTTAIDDGTTKAPTAATTTKKPAVVDTVIPSTGSSVLVPAVALLALAAGTVAVIKTKKDN